MYRESKLDILFPTSVETVKLVELTVVWKIHIWYGDKIPTMRMIVQWDILLREVMKILSLDLFSR